MTAQMTAGDEPAAGSPGIPGFMKTAKRTGCGKAAARRQEIEAAETAASIS